MMLWNHGANGSWCKRAAGERNDARTHVRFCIYRLITVADWLAWVWEVRPDQGSVAVRPLQRVKTDGRSHR